ncbi:hypothetical protein ACPDHL_11955 [Myroides sp. C15-4]|uniref:hypothetical protein n=1 Tax=Myroides sp. C15-4 TaxID=3400532 RepID=UPI003D2F80B0
MREEILDYKSAYIKLKGLELIESDELYLIKCELKREIETLENKLVVYQYGDEKNLLIQTNVIDFFDSYIRIIHEMKVKYIGKGLGLSISQGMYERPQLLLDLGNQIYEIIVNGNKAHASRTLKVDYEDVIDFDVYLEFLKTEYLELKKIYFNNLLEVIKYHLLLSNRLSDFQKN